MRQVVASSVYGNMKKKDQNLKKKYTYIQGLKGQSWEDKYKIMSTFIKTYNEYPLTLYPKNTIIRSKSV